MGSEVLLAVVADSLDGATLHGLGAGGNLLIRRRLLADEGNTLVIIAGEEVGGGFAAEITVDAGAVDIELARYILFGFIVDIGHNV